MKKLIPILLITVLISSVIAIAAALAENPTDQPGGVADEVEKDYLDLIDQHIAKLSQEYNVSGETESLLVRRAIENYVVADLVDYTLLIFMAKYNVATGGIDMKRANSEIITSLNDLSDSSNRQMLDNINALRIMKGLPSIRDGKAPIEKSD